MQISGSDFCRLLRENGWQLERIKGSHHIYAKVGVRLLVTVPVHGNKPLKKGTLARLAKIAAIRIS